MTASGVLRASSLCLNVARAAPVVSGDGVVVGRTRLVGGGLAVDDLGGEQVFRVGRAVMRILRNDRYPVFDAADERVGWLGTWEGVLRGEERIGALLQRHLFRSDCEVVGGGRGRDQRPLGALTRLPPPGHRTSIFSTVWRVTFVPDVTDADVRALVAASAFVWHYGRGEE